MVALKTYTFTLNVRSFPFFPPPYSPFFACLLRSSPFFSVLLPFHSPTFSSLLFPSPLSSPFFLPFASYLLLSMQFVALGKWSDRLEALHQATKGSALPNVIWLSYGCRVLSHVVRCCLVTVSTAVAPRGGVCGGAWRCMGWRPCA